MLKSFRWSFKWQFLTAILCVLLPTLLLYTWIAGNVLLASLDKQLTSRLNVVANMVKIYLPIDTMTDYLPNDETTQTYQKDLNRLSTFTQSNQLDRISILTNQGLVRIDTSDWIPGSPTGLNDTMLQNPSGALSRLHQNAKGEWRKIVLTRLDEDHLLRLSAGSDMFASIDRVRVRRTIILVAGILLAILLSFGMAFLLGRRFSKLSSAFQDMQSGQNAIQVPVKGSDELAFLTQSFNEMSRELTRKNQQERDQHENRISELKVLSAGIAHEIRNPLSAISGLAELLARQSEIKENTDHLDLVNRILNEIKRLDIIVMDVMAYARQPELTLSSINLAALESEILAIDAQCNIQRAQDFQTVRADRAGLLTLLRNLLLNARQAAGTKGLVSVSFAYQKEMATIQVTDNGPGINAQEAQNIFQPFFTKKSNGTGLGLAISRNIAEAHGGHLTFKTQNQGTTFIISLPQIKES